jgi:hypothetical protein
MTKEIKMTAPINIYRNTQHQDEIEREWLDRSECGDNYTMKLKSLKPVEGSTECWKGIFEVEPNLLYSQRFWENSTDIETLRQLINTPITCGIEIVRGFQRITNIEIVDDQPTDTMALKTRAEAAKDDSVPF